MSSDFPTVVFVHGYTSSPQTDWYPEMKMLLEKEHIPFRMPALPGMLRPRPEEWLDILHREIASIEGSVILVGHSLGTRAVMLYMEKYKPLAELVLLISPPANDTHENRLWSEGLLALKPFYMYSIDPAILKPLAKQWIVMHSTDDDTVSFDQGELIAGELDATLLTYKGRGHFCDPKDAAEILEVLKRYVQ